MQRFLVYRCPNTGMNVQASFVWKDGDEPEDRSELYEYGSTLAASGAEKKRLKIGEPNVIRQ